VNVVFDVGNVILRWDPRFLYRRLFDLEHEMEDFLASVCTGSWNLEQDRGRSFAEGVRALQEVHPHHAETIAAFDVHWHETLPHAIEDTVAVVEHLYASGVPLYAITNFNGDKFRETLQRFPVLNRFRDIVVSGDEGILKPEPEIYRLLLKRNGLQASECIFIDDSLVNVKGAEAVGMLGHHYQSPEGLRMALRQAGLLSATS
jgi:2-haloacid dehalogenase